MFAKAIPSPDDDPEVKALRKQQNLAHAEIQSNSEIVVQFKRQTQAFMNVLGPQSHGPTRAEEERAKAASRQVRAARAKLRELEMPLRDARGAAAKRILADVRPSYLELLGDLTLAYLKKHADEIVAFERVLAMRQELDARQISMATLVFPTPPFVERNLERAETRHQMIRQDTKTMIEAGAIKAGDLPPELRKVWRF